MKRVIILFALVFAAVSIVGCSSDKYGNTDDQILKFLKNSDYIKDLNINNINIADTVYINNTKYVGFTSPTHHGIAVYEKDSNNNYIYKAIEQLCVNSDVGLSLFRTSYKSQENCNEDSYGYLAFSYGNNVAKVELIINKIYNLSCNISTDSQSLKLIQQNIPKNEAKSLSLKYKFYDIENNIIFTNEQ